MQVQSLSWEDPLEEEMATPSSILVWEIPLTEEPGGYSPWGCSESDVTEQLSTHTARLYKHHHLTQQSHFSEAIAELPLTSKKVHAPRCTLKTFCSDRMLEITSMSTGVLID